MPASPIDKSVRCLSGQLSSSYVGGADADEALLRAVRQQCTDRKAKMRALTKGKGKSMLDHHTKENYHDVRHLVRRPRDSPAGAAESWHWSCSLRPNLHTAKHMHPINRPAWNKSSKFEYPGDPLLVRFRDEVAAYMDTEDQEAFDTVQPSCYRPFRREAASADQQVSPTRERTEAHMRSLQRQLSVAQRKVTVIEDQLASANGRSKQKNTVGFAA